MKKHILLFGIVLPVFIAVGCDVGDVCGCPPATFDGIVHGQIATSAGDPVTDARVSVYTRVAVPDTSFFRGAVRTDESGFYRKRIRNGAAAQIDSIRIVVDLPPIGSGTPAADTTVAAELRMRPSPPYDSVRVDVVLDL